MVGRCFPLLLLLAVASSLHAQARTTASRIADAQLGFGFVTGKPDYVPEGIRGLAVYGDLDFTRHLGVEAEFHQVDTTSGDQIYQRTYQIGGRYFRTYGPVVPYVKALIGRGDLNYPHGLANLGYTVYAGGAGADLKLGIHLRLRGDYEYQKWTTFPNGGLTPQLVTIGIAFHFVGKPRYK